MLLHATPWRDESGASDDSWLSASVDLISTLLVSAGAVLIRGLNIDDPHSFAEVARTLMGNLGNYVGGDAPRKAVTERVYDATSFAAEDDLSLHNELSYSGNWPKRLAFCALLTARRGGQTTVASGQSIYAELDPSVREPFEKHGVTYLQHLRNKRSAGTGKTWQATFESESQFEVEQFCTRHGISFEWTSIGIRTSRTNPGVRLDSASGRPSWFNQADLWHAAFDHLKQRDLRSGEIDLTKQLGSHATFGDGNEIPVQYLHEVRRAYGQCEVAVEWQDGDVLVLNNELILHGRKSYVGPRQVLVAMDRFGGTSR